MAQKEKKVGGGPLGFIRRHKVLSIVGGVLLVGIVAVSVIRSRAAKAAASSNYQFVRTTVLSKTSLEDSVTVNGTVKSGEEATVTVEDANKTYKVATVNVAVGDTVHKGDVIATLDTSAVEQKIASAQQDYNDSLEKAQTSYSRAAESYNVELVKHQNDLIDAQEEIEKAQKNLDEITENFASLQGDYSGNAANYEKVKYYYDLYSQRIAEAQNTVTNKQTEYDQMLNSGSEEDQANAKQSLDEAQNNLAILKNQCNAPELGLFSWDDIVKAYQNVDSLTESVEKAHDSYDDTKNYPQSLTSAYNSLIDATTSLAQAKRPSTTLTDLQTDLENCTLTATMDGTVTALTATVGSACTGAVATIQDTDELTVEVTIPASNVPKLKVGMDCIVTSDATGDTKISGTLTRIDPVANENGSFGATVTVYGDATNLLIGIQAKVEIIVSSKQGVFTVPYDAIGTAEDGSSYVLRATGGSGTNMTFEQVKVTVGDANDYYVEITGDSLAEGDTIRSSADLSEGIESSDNTDDPTMMMSMEGDRGDRGGNGGDGGNGAPPSGGGAPGGA